jgi:hypothetical protein
MSVTAFDAAGGSPSSQIFGLVAYADGLGNGHTPAGAVGNDTCPISVMVVVDRMVVPNVNVTHTAAGGARVMVSVGYSSDRSYIHSSMRHAIRMLRAICGANASFNLDSIVVCGPDLHGAIDEIQLTVRSAWDSAVASLETSSMAGLSTTLPTALAAGPAANLPTAPAASSTARSTARSIPYHKPFDSNECGAAEARVLQRIASGGGVPNFTLKSMKAINSARNYIVSTQGNINLSNAVVEAVRKKLATM